MFVFRGCSSEESQAFRAHYSRISELRSLVPQNVPVLALTATATKSTETFIVNNLCMNNPLILSSTPNRLNIKYSVIKLESRLPEHLFEPVIVDIQNNFYKAKRVLVFCRVMRDVRTIYGYFHKMLCHQFNNYMDKPYAQFHSQTEDVVKNYILEQFSKENGKVRFLVATIAFGMGINCEGLHTVIHFGPPPDIDDYFQESGRAGRDNQPSNAILVIYPRCLSSKRINKSMKNYSKNVVKCRRKILLNEFGESKYDVLKLHECCDVCEKYCNCDQSLCSSTERFYVLNMIQKYKDFF